MFSLLSKCWGTMGVQGTFESARLNAVYPDWNCAAPQSINQILVAFKGQNKDTRGQTAVNMFFSHLQRDQQSKSMPFLLKHIYIMDRAVQQQIQMDVISHYYNSELLYLKKQPNQQLTQFTGKYFLYVKEKAKIYMSRNRKIFDKNSRKQFLRQCSVLQIFGQIDAVLQIQKMINQVNQKFADNNRNVDLINAIFVAFLKCYLFCYSVVTLGIFTLFQKIDRLNPHQLRSLQKLINYFNKDYTKKFFEFIEKNKSIQAFKAVKYTELIQLKPSYFLLIEQMLKTDRKVSQQIYPIEDIPIDIKQMIGEQFQMVVIPEQHPVQVIKLTPRIKLEVIDSSKVAQLETNFTSYQNLYSQSFNTQTESMRQSKFKGKRMESIFVDIASEKQSQSTSIQGKSAKFNTSTWNGWKNIYAY